MVAIMKEGNADRGGGREEKTPSTREEGKRWGVCSHHRDGHRLPALFFQRPNAGGDGKNRPPRSETPTPRTLTTGPSAHGVSEPRLLGKEKGRMRGACSIRPHSDSPRPDPFAICTNPNSNLPLLQPVPRPPASRPPASSRRGRSASAPVPTDLNPLNVARTTRGGRGEAKDQRWLRKPLSTRPSGSLFPDSPGLSLRPSPRLKAGDFSLSSPPNSRRARPPPGP